MFSQNVPEVIMVPFYHWEINNLLISVFFFLSVFRDLWKLNKKKGILLWAFLQFDRWEVGKETAFHKKTAELKLKVGLGS